MSRSALSMKRVNEAAKIAMDNARDDYFEAVNILYRAEADSQENLMDLQYENHCRAGGGGENNPNFQEMYTNMSERHQKRDNSTTSSVSL